MSQSFEIAVTVACWVIAIAFVAQVVVLFLVFRLVQKVVAAVEDLRKRFEPQIGKIQATLGDVQKTVAHVTATTTTLSTEVRAVSAALTTSAERITTVATESADEIRSLVLQASSDIKAMVRVTSTEVQDLVVTSSDELRGAVKESADSVRGVVKASSESAHGNIERLDLAVERTVGRFEETGEYVQDQVLTPVREVAAIVTGIKVALETLFGYPDRKQIDQAYQDEELFI